ncbi:MAG: hypothetical protein K8T90_20285 [Planctomycetes bacterium]|nr:hypothetical protein [Planctomycetota bacterium]
MAHFPDLAPRAASGGKSDVSIGWLSSGHAFPTGAVPPEFTSALARLREVPFALTRGFHVCEFCMRNREDDSHRFDACSASWNSPEYGNGEILVLSETGVAYVAPRLVLHYVTEHGYRPPQEFIDAVLFQSRRWARGDRPVSFGYTSVWVAVRGRTPIDVVEALRLTSVVPVAWADGIDAAYGGRVFVAPPLDGWVLAASTQFPDSGDGDHPDRATPFVEALSQRFGEVQYFGTHRVVEWHAWARAINGTFTRKFSWIGERGEVLWNEGARTDVERELHVGVEPDGTDDVQFPDEEHVLTIAAQWGVGPGTLDDRTDAPRLGYEGRLRPA